MIRLLPLLLVGCIVAALLAQQAPQSGETLFFGKAGCASCHEVNGRGGIVGPDLSNAGRLSADALRQKIVDPSTNLNPGARQAEYDGRANQGQQGDPRDPARGRYVFAAHHRHQRQTVATR